MEFFLIHFGETCISEFFPDMKLQYDNISFFPTPVEIILTYEKYVTICSISMISMWMFAFINWPS